MFKKLLIGLWLLSACVMANAAEPVGGKLTAQFDFNIPTQPLSVSLKQLANEAGIQILFEERVLKDVQAPALKGKLSVSQALDFLLNNTGLEYASNGATVAVRRKERVGAPPVADSRGSDTPNSNAALDAQQSTGAQDASPVELTEVIVTAQKRSERLQDVPIPVSVVSAETLVESNQLRLQDYSATIPGFSYVSNGFGVASLAIRGLYPVGGNSTVGVVIDDVPYLNVGGLATPPDLDPSDLQRVEVLRGPQGTLYGADSMGGLLKYVTTDPSTSGWSGRLQADINSVYNGDPTGYGVRGALNVPISDTLAVRLSGFGRRDPGYIDNIQTGQKGINWENAVGGHLSALWQPSDDFSMKFSALIQNATTHGFPMATLGSGFGDLQQSDLRGTGWSHTDDQTYSLTLKAHLGPGDLTFLSGYNQAIDAVAPDFTNILGQFTYNGYGISPAFTGFGVTGTELLIQEKTRQITEELRYSLPIGHYVDFQVGGFYMHQNSSPWTQTLLAMNTEGAAIGFVGQLSTPEIFEEYAVFSDLTINFTDRFNIQVGARESRNRQRDDETDTGPFALIFEGASPLVVPQTNYSADDFTYLISPQFKVSPDLMVYARAASGYRPGSPNPQAAVIAVGVPGQSSPDTTRSYEIGAKGSAFDHALSFDTSVYYIDWNNIQISETDPTTDLGYTANAGHAKSQGVEISLEARPWKGMTIAPWVAFSDAVLTQGFPAAADLYAPAGSPLPYANRFSGYISVKQDFQLWRQVAGYVAGGLTYVGESQGTYNTVATRQENNAYAKTDIRAGANYQSWAFTLYANNLFDKRAIVTGGIASAYPDMVGYIPPRTVGLSVSKTFK